jgi:AcrR family transcriptional regulator
MPRPRFERLDPDKKKAILDAAAEEFAEHGFANASFNRIIEKTGVSKGAIYYYFDDKEDLYLTIVAAFQAQLLEVLGEFGEVPDVDSFWAELEEVFRRAGQLKSESPNPVKVGVSMLKGVLTGELPHSMLDDLYDNIATYLRHVMLQGQKVGAVRRDLPLGLLMALIMGMSEGMDLWAIHNVPAIEKIDYDAAVALYIALYKRLLRPGPDTLESNAVFELPGHHGPEEQT